MRTTTATSRQRIVGTAAFAVVLIAVLAGQRADSLLAQGAAGRVPANLRADQVFIGTPWIGEPGILETVDEIMARGAREPKFSGRPREKRAEQSEGERFPRLQNPDAPAVSEWPPAADVPDRAIGPSVGFSLSTNWNGVTVSESDFIPPDSIGAVGPTQVLVCANGRFKLYDKTGTLLGLDVSDAAFFASVSGGADISDPHVRYDRLSNRWYVTEITITNTSNRILLAVSSGPTITSSSSFTFFQFQHDLVGPTPNIDTGHFADYDTLGVDDNALYIGVNEFTSGIGNFQNTTGYVVNKADLIKGMLTVTAFRGLAVGTGPGPFTPQGVDNDDPAATEGYFIGVDNQLFSRLDIRRVTDPGGTPAISGNLMVTVPTTSFPIDQVAQGSTSPLDALDDRLYAAMIKKGSLWTAHNIAVNASGVGVTTGSDRRNASRWYQIGNLTMTPALFQSGTVFDPAASNPNGYWIPSIAANGQFHAAIGMSIAGNNTPPGIAMLSRLGNDTPGTMADQATIPGVAGYNVQTGVPRQRWGDYSQVVVDPNDDMTMWTFQEIANATNSWAVRAIKLMAPPPAQPASATSPLGGAASTIVTITGTSTAGSGFFDPGFGFPNHLTASVSGGVTVNSATFIDPTHVQLDISTVAAPPGAKNVTIINPDGQMLTGVGILTVPNAAPTISVISNQSTPRNTPIMVSFTVGDDGGAAPVTMSGMSSNTAIVPNSNLVFGGSGASRNLTITPTTSPFGSTTITLTASDGTLMTNAVFELVVVSSGLATAVFDATLMAPRCNTVGGSCDSGTLLVGRDTISGGAEPNQPNTINNSCADGMNGVFHRDESLDRIKVTTLDGGMFAPGKTVRVELTLWAFSDSGAAFTFADDKLDVFVTGNAASPTWTFLTSFTPTMAGLNTFSTTYVLPAGGLQAIRANFRFLGSNDVCTSGNFDDHDDLIFRVGNPGGDLNLDAASDLFWRNRSTGQNIGWLMNGTTVVTAAFFPTIADTNWQIRGVGDFNGNGKADVIWRNRSTGQNIVWLMDGLVVVFSTFLPTIADTNWEIQGVGDFNGDAKADVIWRNRSTGQNIAWLMDGATVGLSAFLPTIADTNWEIREVGDFNGNGKADVILRNRSTGQNIVWLMNGAAVDVAAFLPTIADTNWEFVGSGDLDGDGKADLLLRNRSTGQNIAWLMNGATVSFSTFLVTIADTNWEIRTVGDLDADGHADIVWRNRSTGQNIGWLMNGPTIHTAVFLVTIADTNWEVVGP